MKIAVVGAGAMGSLFGARLHEAGEDVWLVDPWLEHVQAIRDGGLRFEEDEAIRAVPVPAVLHPRELGYAEVVLLFVKTPRTRQAMRDALPIITPRTTVVTLQNGIGNVEAIREVAPDCAIVFGMTTLSSDLAGPGHIRSTYVGRGGTYLWSAPRSQSWHLEQVAAALNRAGIYTEIRPDVDTMIWKKVTLNAVMNTVAAITRLRVGQILDCPDAFDLAGLVAAEVVEVARRRGIPLELDDTVRHLVQVAEESPDHTPSMLIDILHGRLTEIESLNGAIVKEGERQGVPTPANRVLTDLVRILESTHGRA